MPATTNCLRYWDLADHIQITDAIALWCGVEPAELAKLNFETRCMSAKVLPDGLYELNGEHYKSLSAAARAITGTNWSGPAFFGVKGGRK